MQGLGSQQAHQNIESGKGKLLGLTSAGQKYDETQLINKSPCRFVARLVEQQLQRRCGSGTVVPSPPRRVHQAGWSMYADAPASHINSLRADSGQLPPASATKSSSHLLEGLPAHLRAMTLNRGFQSRMRRVQRPSSELAALPTNVHLRCLHKAIQLDKILNESTIV